MIPADLVTHTATVFRQGTRTSDSGDTVTDGDYEPVWGAVHSCIAEQVAGGADASVQRSRARATWHVTLDPGVDVRVRDQVVLADSSGSYTATVVEVRRYSVPASTAHTWVRCEEVTG